MSSVKFILLLTCQILGLLWFLKGFFPRKATLSGFNTFNESSSPFAIESGAHFDKLIVMVVDAMRSDFMFSSQDSSMHFLHSLIREGNALPFTSFSNPPTVTLPRLKGITTGGTPSFVDAILNIADDKDQSQGLEKVDSWIYQFKNSNKGRKLHFFGDDTWLKLFPPGKFFERFEGTTSFFVSDFTEVDYNVTRHLDSEINDQSWDALILHYLGLDHIGHTGGPKSVYMPQKQAEMDSVLEKLYSSRIADNDQTLLVLLGDHGMNDMGNHGGASAGETSPGLVLVSPKFSGLGNQFDAPLERKHDYRYYSSMSQIDIVPTLSALFNFPIPRNNLGIILPQVLALWPDDSSKKVAVLENCRQFVNLLAEKYSKTDSKYKSFLDEFQYLSETNGEPVEAYFAFLKKIQNLLIENSTNYSYFDINSAFCVIFVSTLGIWHNLFRSLFKEPNKGWGVQVFFSSFCLLYSLHFHGSSLIEEEHQVWWYLTIAVLFLHLLVSRLYGGEYFALCLVSLRLVRGWNDSGQKFVSDSTIAKLLVSNPKVGWVLVMMTYFLSIIQIYNQEYWDGCFKMKVRHLQITDIISLVRFIFISFISSLSFSFKLIQFAVDGNDIPSWLRALHAYVCGLYGKNVSSEKKDLQSMNIEISRLFFVGLFTIFLGQLIIGKIRGNKHVLVRDMVNITTLLLIHQTRIEVIPIFIIFASLKGSYSKLLRKTEPCEPRTKVLLITLFILCLQNLSFFSVGNTNSLATVDLSNAYNGISEYNVLFVGILTFVSNFAVVIYWSFAATELLANEVLQSQNLIDLKSLSSIRASLTLAFYSISTLNLIASCIHLRFHLFIWSVFSPKLLYFSVWVILINFVFDLTFNFLVPFI
ncbi:hypothetical protein JCM33374_g3445 [Metschnikowia sp. JCM 33374]|nr:hypothetical protein JCM33374_g3445 [Metschnikowia sp. JCM 33374]